MDPVLISVLAIVAGFLAALIGAVFGSVVGPMLNARFERAGLLSAFVRDQRREAYSAFTVEVERVQRLLDATIAGAVDNSYSVSDLEQLEIARVKIDLYGTHQAKIWAYRCTLAFTALLKLIDEHPGNEDFVLRPRAKLHEARANLVRIVRYELGVTANERDPQSKRELQQTKAEIGRNDVRADRDGHRRWLDEEPEDPAARMVSAEAVAAYRRAVRAAQGLVDSAEGPDAKGAGS